MTITLDLFHQLNFFKEPALREEILKHCQLKSFKKGDIIVRAGQFVKVLPIVISGSIRVSQNKGDRELLLYYVEASQTCIMSLSACFFNTESPSQALAVGKTVVLIVPTSFIVTWQRKYNSWNEFVIKTFRERYDDLLDVLQNIAFNHIDRRVLNYLQNRALKQQGRDVRISHQELARELGTTRVVISRILKQFELDGKLKLNRSLIKLL